MIKEKFKNEYDDRETHWKLRDKRAKENLERKTREKPTDPYATEYHRQEQDFLYIASSTMKTIKKLILANMIDKAKELIEIGKSYIEKAIEIKDRHSGTGKKMELKRAQWLRKHLYYQYIWVDSKEENLELLKEVYDLSKEIVVEDKTKKRYKLLKEDRQDLIYDALRVGEFQTAKKYVWEWANKKETSNRIKSDLDVVYEAQPFLILITGYLAEPKKNKDLYPKIMVCFDKFFEEMYNLNVAIDLGYRTLDDHIEMAYLKYKYFSEEEVKLDPIEIIQSLRYGYRCRHKE